MKKHSDKKFECKICFKFFLSSISLYYHMRNMHSEKKLLHKCTLCTASFGYHISIQRHIEKHHAKEKNEVKYTCDICGEQYYLKNYLQSHMRTHSQPFKCLHEDCTKTFTNVGGRRRHYLSKHKEHIKVSYFKRCLLLVSMNL